MNSNYYVNFSANKYLPSIHEPIHFRLYGFKNKQDRKLLCKYTKQLMAKYPKTKKGKKKKQLKQQEESVEGNVDDTGVVEWLDT